MLVRSVPGLRRFPEKPAAGQKVLSGLNLDKREFTERFGLVPMSHQFRRGRRQRMAAEIGKSTKHGVGGVAQSIGWNEFLRSHAAGFAESPGSDSSPGAAEPISDAHSPIEEDDAMLDRSLAWIGVEGPARASASLRECPLVVSIQY